MANILLHSTLSSTDKFLTKDDVGTVRRRSFAHEGVVGEVGGGDEVDVDREGVDEQGVDEIGVDEVGVGESGVDEGGTLTKMEVDERGCSPK
jgi:hypothetical protein